MRPSLTPPAIIQPAATLWDWAKAEADAIAAMLVRLNDKQVDLATITAVVEESIEYGELEEARERLKAAKTAALDCDAVERASGLLAKARKALKAVASSSKAKAIAGEVKALKGVVEEGKSRLAHGLAVGRVPTTVGE
jgi:hypothetical protein